MIHHHDCIQNTQTSPHVPEQHLGPINMPTLFLRTKVIYLTTLFSKKYSRLMSSQTSNNHCLTNFIPTSWWWMMKMMMHDCRRMKYDDNVKRMVCCWVNSLLIVLTVTSNQIRKAMLMCSIYLIFIVTTRSTHTFISFNAYLWWKWRCGTFQKLLSWYTFMWYQSTKEVICSTMATLWYVVKYFENIWWAPNCGRILEHTGSADVSKLSTNKLIEKFRGE